MATGAGGTLSRLYRSRIGVPSTDDEVAGYWLFALGIVLGVAGLVLFFFSPTNSLGRMLGYVAGATGLVALVVGPTIRLPLSRRATLISYAGGLLCLVAVAWFLVIYPDGWERPTGNVGVVTVYAAGLAIAAIGAVLAPLVSGPTEELAAAEAAADAARAERDVADARTDAATKRGDAATERAQAAAAELEDATERLETALAENEATGATLAVARETLASHEESKAAFELYEDRGGEWRWRLVHRNGNLVADSGEGYSSRQKATQGLQSVRTNALGAAVAVTTSDAGAPAEPPAVLADDSQGTFEMYEDSAGEHRWRLRHDNGNILADSGEGYASRSNARRAVATVRRVADGAVAVRPDPVAFEVYADRAGEFRWRLVHRNGNVLADSGEGYVSRSNARRAVDTVRERASDPDATEIYEDEAGEFRWRLTGANGELVADSGEGYTDRSDAEDAVVGLREYAPDAGATGIGGAAFEVFADASDEHRWRLRARNGRIVADSGQSYSDRSGTHEAVDRVKRHAPGADETVLED